jgi:peptidoglycan/xylan/chitin deacetylase (PgdA/CDA1 family)
MAARPCIEEEILIANPITWPNGARVACCISFDMDADSLIHISRKTDGFDRLNPISMGRYGPNVAVPRILETYRRFGLKQTFFIPAWCMERYPEAVEAILKAGHEIAHHSYLHEDPLSHTDVEQGYWFERAMEVHRQLTGLEPRGYRAPVYNVTQGVVDRLISNGFLYDSSLMADDIPYLMKAPKGDLWEAPAHWGTDDWPPFAHYAEIDYLMPVRAPSDGLRASFEEFEAHLVAGGFWMPVWHPFLTGRLARWMLVERFLEKILSDGKVWFAPVEEIIRHSQAEAAAGRWEPRIENLPYYDKPVHL